MKSNIYIYIYIYFKRTNSVSISGESSQDETEEDPTPISMKVSRGESEEFKARRMASYEYVNQKREEERWIKMTYFSADVSHFITQILLS